MIYINNLEEIARQETNCRGCNRPKEIGLVVCWDCFKYRKDTIPFKYFNESFEAWLLQLPSSKK